MSTEELKILVCPSGFKGSLQPGVAADCIEAGILSVFPNARVFKIPLLDGGEGFTHGLVLPTGGTIHRIQVTGPTGTPVKSYFGILGQAQRETPQTGQQALKKIENQPPSQTSPPVKTAIIEMAAAAGLSLVPPHLRNPGVTTTFGVGEQILSALDAGALRIIVGCGDSGTCDGGAGMLQCLGARLFDARGEEIPTARGGESLRHLDHIDLGGLDPRLRSGAVKIEASVSWTSVLTGPGQQAGIFSGQKGATAHQAEILASCMSRLADASARALGCSASEIGRAPGSGASGGLGTALRLIGATLRPRYDVMADFSPLLCSLLPDEKAGEGACELDLVITAEGGIDGQTPQGKMPADVARRARRLGVPVVAIAGTVGEGARENLAVGIDAFACMMQGPTTLGEAVADAERLAREAAETVMRIVGVGLKVSERCARKRAAAV
ncbi:hypothetical protein RB596_001923 [Gaeumannomyces avenae]